MSSARPPTREDDGRPERPPVPWGRLVVLAAAVLLIGALTGEVLLRLPELRCAGGLLYGQKGLFQLDQSAGYVMRPNLCVRLKSDEFDEVLRTNGRGLVGPDVADPKPIGEFRVVVLGDGYTAGGHVPFERTFTALLEQRLHESGYRGVRVVNAGVGGWSTVNQAGYLSANVGWLQPDLVVVAAYAGDDIGQNILATRGGYRDAPEHPKGITWGYEAADMLRASHEWFPRNGQPQRNEVTRYDPIAPLPTPVFGPSVRIDPEATAQALSEIENALAHFPAIRPEESLDEYRERLLGLAGKDQIPSGPAGRYIAEALRRASLLRTRTGDSAEGGQVRPPSTPGRSPWDELRGVSRLMARIFGEPQRDFGAVTTAPGAAPPAVEQKLINIGSFEWTILRHIPPDYWLDLGWPLFGDYLRDIRETADSVGAHTLLMIIPHMGQFDDAMRARIMADYRFQEGEVDWDRPQKELVRQAQRLNVPFLDLLPIFQERADRDALYFRLDTHFTALGHGVAAERLAIAIQAAGWLR